jgi:hypothetical protein
MIVSLTILGRELFSFEVGRRFRVVSEGETLVHLGSLTEVAGDDSEDEDEQLPFGFAP